MITSTYKFLFLASTVIITCAHGALASEAFVLQSDYSYRAAIPGNFSANQLLSVPIVGAAALTRENLPQSNLSAPGNSAELIQSGSNNNSTIFQSGTGNLAAIFQRGQNNTATVTQYGRKH
jgi:hypothetical protein